MIKKSISEKDKILNYSKDRFFKDGFYKVTMDNIASGMRISKKTIYKYFTSKESLVESIVHSVKSASWMARNRHGSEDGGTPERHLHHIQRA